jgi:hypothetical protein
MPMCLISGEHTRDAIRKDVTERGLRGRLFAR